MPEDITGMNDKLFVRGKKRIALRLDCGIQQVLKYIKKEGLPAFKETPNSPYRITVESLERWAKDYQARKKV